MRVNREGGEEFDYGINWSLQFGIQLGGPQCADTLPCRLTFLPFLCSALALTCDVDPVLEQSTDPFGIKKVLLDDEQNWLPAGNMV